MPIIETAAASARRDAARAHRCFVLCLAARNRRERLRWLYEAERMRSEALAQALLSQDHRRLLMEVGMLLDDVRAKVMHGHGPTLPTRPGGRGRRVEASPRIGAPNDAAECRARAV